LTKLFGTDGIRGVANIELTPELAFNIGKSSAHVLYKIKNSSPRIIVGKDTRLSSDMLENALVSGFCSAGAKVTLTGIVPTPARAFFSKKLNFDAGVVISASHNAFYDNGIKFFDSNGFKLSDEIENEIEKIVLFEKEKLPRFSHDNLGYITKNSNIKQRYINFFFEKFKDIDLTNFKIGLDCANGSTFKIAPAIFKKLNANVFIINDKPNKININLNCGSTNLAGLIKLVKEKELDFAFGFDGDGDRCLAIDKHGNIIHGDSLLYIFINFLIKRELLENKTLVTTDMSNLALFNFCRDNNINIISSKVGDRYVCEDMIKNNSIIGGEQSGHIILTKYSTTGDGILTALYLTKIIFETKEELSKLNNLKIFPQVIKNILLNNDIKEKILLDKEIIDYIFKLKNKLKDNRILIRASGTEPVIRIMLDGENKELLEKEADDIEKIFNKVAQKFFI
jgi:phosphoglucosamine mutase